MADETRKFGRDDDPGTNTGTGRGSIAVGEREARERAQAANPPPVHDDRDTDRTRDLDRGDHDHAHDHDHDHDHGRVRDHARGDHDHDGVKDRHERGGLSARDVRAREREEFGGFNLGSAFFGWLVAIGIGALLTALLGAAGAAIGLTGGNADTAESNAGTVSIVGGALLLVVSMIAYYAGGYVAGRMSRFDGARQGFGTWVLGLVVTLLIAAAGWILGDKYNLLDQLNLPRIPVDAGDLTTGGVIALAAIVIGTLIAAIAGGKVGQRYHNKVDRVGFGEKV